MSNYLFPDVYIKRNKKHGFGWSKISGGGGGEPSKYLKEISGYPLSVDSFLSLVVLVVSGNYKQTNGYTEVEYIESNGTQYINTGICPTNNTKVEVTFSSTQAKFVYGSRTATTSADKHCLFFDTSNATNHFQFGLGTETTDVSMKVNTKYTVSISQEGAYLDGELEESYDTQSFSSDLPLYLCGINQTGAEERAHEFYGKIYAFKVYENGVLVQSLVPCIRDIDGAVGMYDTVTKNFFNNSGTGVFVAGSTIAPTPSPDNPIDIELCGDKTMNLCPINTSTVANFSLETEVEEGKTYTFSFIADSVSGEHLNVAMSVLMNGFGGTGVLSAIYCPVGNKHVGTFVAPENGTLFVNGFWTQTISQIQVIEGEYTADTIPDYEPYGYKVPLKISGNNHESKVFNIYTPEQLAKVGDVADEIVIDFENNTVELIKNIGHRVFDGTESWGKNTTSAIRYDLTDSIFANSNNNDYAVICNKYKSLYAVSNKNILLSSSFRGVSVFDSGYSTTEDFKQGLASQYADGDPVYVYFWLATPVTTDITSLQQWDSLPELWEGSMIITSESDIEPSNLNLKYYSSVE